MFRIGIVGSDNSHAERFPELTNLPDQPADKHVDGAQVVALFGLDPVRTEQVATKTRIPKIVSDPKEMLGMVDAVMVVFRHGGLHRQYAEPFIKAGIPTFIDKPLAASPADAEAIVELAQRTGTPITSFSTLRYATGVPEFVKGMAEIAPVRTAIVTSPADRGSEYGGLVFYAIHASELLLEMIGPGIEEVQAAQYGQNVMAVMGHKSGILCALNLIASGYGFDMMAYGDKGRRKIEVDASTCYREGFKVFLEMLRTGKPPLPYDEMVESVRIIDAVERSLQAGKAVRL